MTERLRRTTRPPAQSYPYAGYGGVLNEPSVERFRMPRDEQIDLRRRMQQTNAEHRQSHGLQDDLGEEVASTKAKQDRGCAERIESPSARRSSSSDESDVTLNASTTRRPRQAPMLWDRNGTIRRPRPTIVQPSNEPEIQSHFEQTMLDEPSYSTPSPIRQRQQPTSPGTNATPDRGVGVTFSSPDGHSLTFQMQPGSTVTFPGMGADKQVYEISIKSTPESEAGSLHRLASFQDTSTTTRTQTESLLARYNASLDIAMQSPTPIAALERQSSFSTTAPTSPVGSRASPFRPAPQGRGRQRASNDPWVEKGVRTRPAALHRRAPEKKSMFATRRANAQEDILFDPTNRTTSVTYGDDESEFEAYSDEEIGPDAHERPSEEEGAESEPVINEDGDSEDSYEPPPGDEEDAQSQTPDARPQSSRKHGAASIDYAAKSGSISGKGVAKTPLHAQNTPSKTKPARPSTSPAYRAKDIVSIDKYSNDGMVFFVRWKKAARRSDGWLRWDVLPRQMVRQYIYNTNHEDGVDDLAQALAAADAKAADGDGEDDGGSEDDLNPVTTPSSGRKRRSARTAMDLS